MMDEQHISQQLLIELLAHQFAFPVRWIETQDAIFLDFKNVERLVELGPSSVLASMAKRTRDLKYSAKDAVLGINRSFMSCTRDQKKLHFDYDVPSATDEESEAPPVAKVTAAEDKSYDRVERQMDLAIDDTEVPDGPITSLERIQAVVSCKLKRRLDAVPATKSIKELSSGRSTLQNELIGDLLSEFGFTPDGAEDMALSTLAVAMNVPDGKPLGPELATLVSKYVAASMPVGMNMKAVREYLTTSWGLGTMRQSAVLLHAVADMTCQNTKRYDSIKDAHDALDRAALEYAGTCGLSLMKRQPGSSTASLTAHVSVDPVTYERVSRETRTLAQKQHIALGQYLGHSMDEHISRLLQLTQLHKSDQERLDSWSAEFDLDFENGIKPHFRSKHIRRFNFWWNQSRVEVMRLYYDILLGRSHSSEDVQKIASKSDQQTLGVVNALCLESRRCQKNGLIGVEMQKLACAVGMSLQKPPTARFSFQCMKPQTSVGVDGSIHYTEVLRFGSNSVSSYRLFLEHGVTGSTEGRRPTSCLVKHETGWSCDDELTSHVFSALQEAFTSGVSFSTRKVLVTGAGPGSIAADIVRNLLMGGATVIVTTSRSIGDAQGFFRNMSSEYAARGAELRVVPFNQGSVADCKDLVDYIYDDPAIGNIDAIIPFAALSERGYEIDGIGSRSELAHRIMLINVIRLLGFIVQRNRGSKIALPPTQVLLPLSPNHGIFGGDGLYSETKLGLETLMNRWHSESWKDGISICGVIIGWTRGTGLMEANDTISELVEANGASTFSSQEMALNISILLTPDITQRCEEGPVIADFGGGLQNLANCKDLIAQHRAEMNEIASIRKAIYDQDAKEYPVSLLELSSPPRVKKTSSAASLASPRIEFPSLPDYEKDISPLSSIEGMVDLSSTVVVVGFSELGPWGSARTRWQMESQGRLTQAGYVELAWMMGLIKHFHGPSQTGQYVGWVDAVTGSPVFDSDVESTYGDKIIAQAGIRLIESDLGASNDPKQKEYLQEIVLEDDLPEFDVDLGVADALRLKHGDNIVFVTSGDSEHIRIKMKAGSRILVPKTAPFLSSLVAGLLPAGWSALKYGVSEEIMQQVDPVTLFTLCCVSEAFYSAGIEDPIEVFKYIHLSELGIFLGSSMGGTEKTREMYRDIYLDKQVQSDVIQETYLNTPAAWINMLLLGGTGPIKTPVGACATGVESIDIGLESIASGKTRMCLVGGFDNFHQDESFGFAKMKATVDCIKEFDAGRTPAEMSRPTAESRSGFVESQGAGVQILCSADLAIEMGLPIYSIVAGSSMAADGFGRSVPAPGQGVLTFARETPDAIHSRILDVEYRRDQMQRAMLDALLQQKSGASLGATPDTSHTPDSELRADYAGPPDYTYDRTLITKTRAIRRQWGNDLRRLDPNISPLRASLAVWGLSVDDVAVASLHGTSTKANDLNEGRVITEQMNHLQRQGPPLLAICQKSITGHPKAPAASWMLNGCLQVLSSGLVPGNLRADNVDPALRDFHHLVYPTQSVQTDGIKAFLLTSFGFGQKGGQMIGVAPRYLFAAIPAGVYEQYSIRCLSRQRVAQQAFARALIDGTICKLRPVQHHPSVRLLSPKEDTAIKLLSREDDVPGIDAQLLRAQLSRLLSNVSPKPSLDSMNGDKGKEELLKGTLPTLLTPEVNQTSLKANIAGVGMDTEDIEAFTSDRSTTFVDRNFTSAERRHITASTDPHSTLVGRWCAKEAVFKSMNVTSKGAGSAMREIEVLSVDGAPKVKLHGEARKAALHSGIDEILVSITYGKQNVAAIALSMRQGGHDVMDGW